MGSAIAHLHWSPATFWECTPHEFFAAVDELSGRDDEAESFAAFKASLGAD